MGLLSRYNRLFFKRLAAFTLQSIFLNIADLSSPYISGLAADTDAATDSR